MKKNIISFVSIMANYVIPPRSKKSDYDKYAAAQDELIALQIANDANVANARKMVKLETPAQLSQRETMSAAELLADIGQQEANARGNLERLGFRPQESADIISAIRRDPALDFSMLNANFPAIEADLKRRFKINLITPTFFVEYFKKYSDDLGGATGMKIFAPPNSDAKVNGLINSVAEMRRLIPDPAQIDFLERAARNAGINNRTILDRLTLLQNALPTQQQLDNLSRMDPVAQQQIVSDILLQVQNLPSRREIDLIIKGINTNSFTAQQIYDNVEKLVNIQIPTKSVMTAAQPSSLVSSVLSLSASSKKMPSAPAPTTMSMGSFAPQQATLNIKGQQIPYTIQPTVPEDGALFIRDPSTKFVDVKAAIIKYGMQNDITDLGGNPVNLNSLGATDRGKKLYFRDTNLADLFDARFPTKTGSGIRMKHPEPKIRLKVGRGIAVQQVPTYREYGKYAVHIPQLENNDILNVKYKSLGPIPKFKPVPVSDIFRDFLLEVLETGKPNPRVYSQIEPQERKLFEEMSVGAGVWRGFGLERTTTSDEEEENKRFELLRGEVIAGNNNPKILGELRKLVIKFMNTGRLRKHDGLNLLMEMG